MRGRYFRYPTSWIIPFYVSLEERVAGLANVGRDGCYEVVESATMQEISGSARLAGCNSASPCCGHKGALDVVMKGDLDAVLKEL